MFGRKSNPENKPGTLKRTATLLAIGAAGFGLVGCGENASADKTPTPPTATPSSEQVTTSTNSNEITPGTTTVTITTTPNGETTKSTTSPSETAPTSKHEIPPQADLGRATGQYEALVDPSFLITSTTPEQIVQDWGTIFGEIADHSIGLNNDTSPESIEAHLTPAVNLLVDETTSDGVRDYVAKVLTASTMGAEGLTGKNMYQWGYQVDIKDVHNITTLKGTSENMESFSVDATFDATVVKAAYDGTDASDRISVGPKDQAVTITFVKQNATYGPNGELSGPTWKVTSIDFASPQQ